MAQPVPRSVRDWLRLAAAVVMVVLPLVIWEDYLRSIYRSNIFAQVGAQTALPGREFILALRAAGAKAFGFGATSAAMLPLLMLASLLVQAIYVVTHVRRAGEAWWRVAFGYVLLLLVLDAVLVTPATGAITRVLLPLTVGFNAMLMGETNGLRFWAWLAAGNLHLIPAATVL